MFFKLINDIPFMVYFHTANTVFFNTEKIMMLACLRKYRGKGSCSHWPDFPFFKALLCNKGIISASTIITFLRKLYSYSFEE